MAELKALVRISNTDLDGSNSIIHGLTKIKGIGFMFSNMVCNLTKIDQNTRVGSLTDAQINAINEFIKNPKAPAWMLNRRKDIEEGTDKHLLAGELDFAKDNDIKRMKMIRSYKGIRHNLGLPVRGQRTKSNFRKNKGKVLGVMRAARPAAAKPGGKAKE